MTVAAVTGDPTLSLSLRPRRDPPVLIQLLRWWLNSSVAQLRKFISFINRESFTVAHLPASQGLHLEPLSVGAALYCVAASLDTLSTSQCRLKCLQQKKAPLRAGSDLWSTVSSKRSIQSPGKCKSPRRFDAATASKLLPWATWTVSWHPPPLLQAHPARRIDT